MIKVPVYDMQGALVGDAVLPEKIEQVEYSVPLMHEVVTGYLANKRKGTHSTKTRGEVSGGGAKPWKQKHTGRARAGSNRSPLWRKGGVVFGPHPRSYRQEVPKKKLRKALGMALKFKASKGKMMILKELKVESHRTSAVADLLKKLKVDGQKALIVVNKMDNNVRLASRNIENLSVLPRESLNSYEVLNARTVIFTEEAFNNI
jgi:large subunit ribosomal protein L4